jgi:predicted RNA-binding Zn ribbon-like protein
VAHGTDIRSIRINGGRLCLDFVNTRSYPVGRDGREFLRTYADLLVWGEREGLLTADRVARLARKSARLAEGADAALRKVLSFRQALRVALEPGAPSSHRMTGLAAINAALVHVHKLRLALLDGQPHFLSEDGFEDWVLGPIALSAADLAASPDRDRIGRCGGPDCHWLFLDHSRNGTRRWCSMESCGNQAKTRQHYQRHRAQNRKA